MSILHNLSQENIKEQLIDTKTKAMIEKKRKARDQDHLYMST